MGATTQPQMAQDVHAFMQAANDLDAVGYLNVKNQMWTDSIFQITISDIRYPPDT